MIISSCVSLLSRFRASLQSNSASENKKTTHTQRVGVCNGEIWSSLRDRDAAELKHCVQALERVVGRETVGVVKMLFLLAQALSKRSEDIFGSLISCVTTPPDTPTTFVEVTRMLSLRARERADKMAAGGGRSFGAEFPPQQSPRPPDGWLHHTQLPSPLAHLSVATFTDVELKKIIDKLANFVSRNGPEFERMTMNKQRDNPKFKFLFGGEWHGYYKWRIATEQGQGVCVCVLCTYFMCECMYIRMYV